MTKNRGHLPAVLILYVIIKYNLQDLPVFRSPTLQSEDEGLWNILYFPHKRLHPPG